MGSSCSGRQSLDRTTGTADGSVAVRMGWTLCAVFEVVEVEDAIFDCMATTRTDDTSGLDDGCPQLAELLVLAGVQLTLALLASRIGVHLALLGVAAVGAVTAPVRERGLPTSRVEADDQGTVDLLRLLAYPQVVGKSLVPLAFLDQGSKSDQFEG